MFTIYIKIFIVLNLPLIPLILARGIRWDRFWFALYLSFFFLASYFINFPFKPHYLHAVFLLTILSLLGINLFFFSIEKLSGLTQSNLAKTFSFFLSLFSLFLTIVFFFDYAPGLQEKNFYFHNPVLPQLTLLSIVLTLLNLTISWEKLERVQTGSKGERVFRIGILIWCMIFFSILAQMIYTGDMASVSFLQLLFLSHLILVFGIYFLILKQNFLEVHAHPSPRFVGHATQSILVLGVLTLFFWFEALGKKWGLPNYSVTVISVILLAGILLFPLLPFRPFEPLQRTFYHHLYLPEQDFALEVSHYLKVMRGEESLERIIEHLRERLNIKSALLYRLSEERGTYRLYLASSRAEKFPLLLSDLPQEGARLSNAPLIKSIPLKNKNETLGYLFLLGERTTFSFEEESLIRFWSETLGLLLSELELKEKEQEQEKLTHFSQASSFILHDAKNLAQLLDLLLKNYQNLTEEELALFFQESQPALEQARIRARRILEKLETFQPLPAPILKTTDIGSVLEEVVKFMSLSLKKEGIAFQHPTEKTPWKGDPDALKRVVENLVLNSLQSEPTETTVALTLQTEQEGYHIRVKDQGKGVPEENRNKLFKPFFTTKRGGNGLGLYQAKVFVEKMGGRIWYEPHLPKGSIFHVWLDKNSHC